MAVMTTAQRQAAADDFMQALSREREQFAGGTKTDCKATIDAIDQWISDNATSFNNALPAVFRNNATPAQKARAMMIVLQKRFLNGT